ncbi:phage integrase SAM-like domain-containing protein [Lachnospiraceae bacterium 48-42]
MKSGQIPYRKVGRNYKIRKDALIAYLEDLPLGYDSPVNPDISFCDYLDITPKVLDTYFKYCLQYGKINQKTKEPEPLSVRSVRDYRNILYAVFAQATIDGILRVNPVKNSCRETCSELIWYCRELLSSD